MVYRKGELSKGQIDREWPHQVEVPDEIARGDKYDVVYTFCRNHNACPRNGLGGYREGFGQLVRYCFKTAPDADAFQARFGGQRLTVRYIGFSRQPIDDYVGEPPTWARGAKRRGHVQRL